MATVGKHVGVKGEDLSLLGNSNLPSAEEGVALTRGQDILVAVKHASNGSVKLLRRGGTDSSQLDRTSFLATETTSQSLDTRDDLVGSDSAYLSDICLAIYVLAKIKGTQMRSAGPYVSVGFCVPLQTSISPSSGLGMTTQA